MDGRRGQLDNLTKPKTCRIFDQYFRGDRWNCICLLSGIRGWEAFVFCVNEPIGKSAQ